MGTNLGTKKITDSVIKSLKTTGKEKWIRIEEGLYSCIRNTGKKYFVSRYSFNKKTSYNFISKSFIKEKQMKKILTGLVFTGILLANHAYAKKVTFCMSYLVGANIEMTCDGDIKGKYTPMELYHKGWTLKTDISGTSKFVLVFEK